MTSRRISARTRTCAFNSGVYLRTGYQLNLGRREAGEYIGVVVRRTGPPAIRGNVDWLSSGDCGSRRGYLEDCDQFPAIRKKGDWNHIRVTFKGPRLQAWLNGTQIVDVIDDPTDPAEASWKEAAPIGFQFPPAGESGGFAGFVKYRNIRAREISAFFRIRSSAYRCRTGFARSGARHSLLHFVPSYASYLAL